MVAESLEKKYQKATYKIVEAVYAVKDGKENLDFYEVLLVTAEKKTIEVEILADGKIRAEEDKKEEKEEKRREGRKERKEREEERGEGERQRPKDEDDDDEKGPELP